MVKRHPVPLLVVIVLTTLGQAGCASRRSLGMGTANPEDISVTWQECAISQGFDWKQAETCFGHSMPLWDESEKANFGSRLDDMESLQSLGSEL